MIVINVASKINKLNQDKNGKYSKTLENLDTKMREVGLFNDREHSRNLQKKIIEIEKERSIQ